MRVAAPPAKPHAAARTEQIILFRISGQPFAVSSASVQEVRSVDSLSGAAPNHLHVKYLMPFHAREVAKQLGRSRRIIVVENNQSGQFARHLRETGVGRQRPRPQVRRRAVRAGTHRRRGKGHPGGAKGDCRSAVHRTRRRGRAPDRRWRLVGRPGRRGRPLTNTQARNQGP